jgi:hypothetical protein
MQKVNNAITISFGLDPYDASSRETDAVATQTIG